jgi:predicted transposase YdaD
MKTDTLFYQLFNTFHTLLFELIDRPIAEAEGYEFSSVEVKEKAFRFDGIFSPKVEDKPINISIPEPISSSTGMASDRYLCKAQL